MNKRNSRRQVLNFSFMSSIVFFVCSLLGILCAYLILLIENVSYLYWLFLLGIAINIFIKGFKPDKFSIIFYTDKKSDFMMSNFSAGMNVMLATMGCYMLDHHTLYLSFVFLFLSVVCEIAGIIMGLKQKSLQLIRLFLFISGGIIAICAVLSFLDVQIN